MTELAIRLKDSCVKNNIYRIPHHECSICGHMVQYEVYREELFFNSSCECVSSNVSKRTWEDAAEWVEMQSNEDAKKRILKVFGL